MSLRVYIEMLPFHVISVYNQGLKIKDGRVHKSHSHKVSSRGN